MRVNDSFYLYHLKSNDLFICQFIGMIKEEFFIFGGKTWKQELTF